MIPNSLKAFPEYFTKGGYRRFCHIPDDEKAVSTEEAKFIAKDLELIMSVWSIPDIVNYFKIKNNRYYYYEFPNMFSTCSGWLPSKSTVIEIKDTNKASKNK